MSSYSQPALSVEGHSIRPALRSMERLRSRVSAGLHKNGHGSVRCPLPDGVAGNLAEEQIPAADPYRTLGPLEAVGNTLDLFGGRNYSVKCRIKTLNFYVAYAPETGRYEQKTADTESQR